MSQGEILEFLQTRVGRGVVTTYRELSLFAYGHTQGAQAVGSMLRAIVARDADASIWTNRVVAIDGSARVAGQLEQLIDEQVPVRNGRVSVDEADFVLHNA